MNIAVAKILAHKVKHSPKFNRTLKYRGILFAKGQAYVVVQDKESGRVFHFGEGDNASRDTK